MKQFLTTAIFLLFLLTTACSQDMAMRKLNSAMFAIENMYVDKVDDNKLAEDAIVAMLAKLDPHSNYLNQEEVKDMNEPLQGNFEGIGIAFNMLTDTLYVVEVISGGPSEKVGLKAGDRIILVNDTLIAGVKTKNSDIMKKLRGKKGTEVRVKVLRDKNPNLIEFNIIRDKIPIYSLDAAYMADKETGYIRLNRFAATSHEEFMIAFNKLKSNGMKSLILDLQNNGGGYLNTAIDLCDEFLSNNKTIVYTEGLRQKRHDDLATSKGTFEKGKLIILIDETSASASEIVAGAIQDWDRGVIIGRRSFGKGLVQRPIPLPDGSMIRLTTARYYTPTGRCIQKPYENGDEESYNKDLADRYNRGEMLHADSIHFPDSLKFHTLVNKRVVYGGGGIMPDYFIPLDTNKYTSFHREVVAKGIMNKVAMNFIDQNRNSIKTEYPNFETFYKSFIVPEKTLDELPASLNKELTDSAKENKSPQEELQKITANESKRMEDFQKSKTLLAIQMKAIIARDMWGMAEYFQIINQQNESYQKALEIINNTKEYNKLLGN